MNPQFVRRRLDDHKSAGYLSFNRAKARLHESVHDPPREIFEARSPVAESEAALMLVRGVSGAERAAASARSPSTRAQGPRDYPSPGPRRAEAGGGLLGGSRTSRSETTRRPPRVPRR